MAGENVFSGLKVVDLSSFIAGPSAATILSDFGADVVKVEPLENLLRARSFQIEGNATLVSIRQLEGIRLFRMGLGRDFMPGSP